MSTLTVFTPGFSALRVYALLGGHYAVHLVVLALGLVVIALNIVRLLTALIRSTSR